MAKKKEKETELPPLPPPILPEQEQAPEPKAQAAGEPVKSPVKSKTFWTGLLVAALGFLGFIQAIPYVANNQIISSLLLMAVGIIMIVLRLLTSQPVAPVFNIPHIGNMKPHPAPQPSSPDDDTWQDWQQASTTTFKQP